MKASICLFLIATLSSWSSADSADPLKHSFVEQSLPKPEAGQRSASPDNLAFSPDGQQLAIVEHHSRWTHNTRQQIRIINFSAAEPAPQTFELGQIDRELLQGQVGDTRPAFSNDGKRLLWLQPRWEPDKRSISVVDVLTGDTIQSIKRDSESPIDSFDFSPDRRLFAACGCQMGRVARDVPGGGYVGYTNAEVRVWDLESGRQRFQHHWNEGAFWTVAFSPDGAVLAVGGGELYGNQQSGEVRLFNVASGKHLQTMRGHKQPVASMTFSPDGKTIVTSGRDCMLRFWNVADGREAGSVSVAEGLPRPILWGVFALSYSPDGSLLAVGLGNWNRGLKQGELRLINAQTKEAVDVLLRKHPSPVVDVQFSADGTKLAACSDEAVKVWRVAKE